MSKVNIDILKDCYEHFIQINYYIIYGVHK